MPKRRNVKIEPRPVFDSIRKPAAPPSQKIGEEKAELRIHPAGRKSKHKGALKEVTEE